MTMWTVTSTYDLNPDPDTMDLWEDKLADLDALVAYVPGRGVEITVHVQGRTVLDAIETSAHVADIVGHDTEELHVITQLEQDRRAEESTIPELMSAAEIAQELGISRQRVHQLRETAAFPAPLADLRGGAVWDASAVRRFNSEWKRKPGRPKAPAEQHQREDHIMAKGHHRSAVTGRYVKAATAARNPRTTVTESGSGKNKGSGTHSRSAITGRYVKGSTAARNPNTTTTERG